MTRRGEFSGLRPHAEMLRRKGRFIADAQLRQALVALHRDQWPGRAEGRAGGGAP